MIITFMVKLCFAFVLCFVSMECFFCFNFCIGCCVKPIMLKGRTISFTSIFANVKENSRSINNMIEAVQLLCYIFLYFVHCKKFFPSEFDR